MYSIELDDALLYLRERANLTRLEFHRLDNAPYFDRCLLKVMEYLATIPDDLKEYADTLKRRD